MLDASPSGLAKTTGASTTMEHTIHTLLLLPLPLPPPPPLLLPLLPLTPLNASASATGVLPASSFGGKNTA